MERMRLRNCDIRMYGQDDQTTYSQLALRLLGTVTWNTGIFVIQNTS